MKSGLEATLISRVLEEISHHAFGRAGLQ